MKTVLTAFATLIFPVLLLAADVTGKWTGTIETPNGSREVNLNLKADGAKLTGTISGRSGDTEIQDGKVDGDNVSFTVIRNFNGNEFKQHYVGKAAGDTITFKLQMRDREVELTVKRATS